MLTKRRFMVANRAPPGYVIGIVIQDPFGSRPVSNHHDIILLKEMAEELFQMQTLAAATRSRIRRKGAADLTETEFLALDILTRHASLTVGEIQKQIGILPAQMSRVVRALEKRAEGGLIKCRINRTDKRRIDLEITKLGQQMHQTYKQVRLESMIGFLQTLKAGDCREFMRICRIIRGEIERILMG